MDRKEYCDRVLAQVGRLTTDEANYLRNELAGHIEAHAEALVEHGYTEEDAAARACLSKSDSARCVWDRWRWYCPQIIRPFSSSTTSLTVVEPTSMPA